MSRRPARLLAVAGVVLVAVVGCGDDGEPAPDASAFEGAWDVSMVIGSVDADPGADPASFPGDTTFRERWEFEDCDADGCTLRRPEGGLLLGDLDDVAFAYTETTELDDRRRFTGTGEAAAVPRPVDEGGHDEEGPEVADDQHCATSGTRRWTVQIEVDERDEVLSGTVLRTPLERQEVVDGLTCFGLDLTIGFSGTPVAAGAPIGDG